MNIKQLVNLASFYAQKVKNGEFEANRAKQEIKSANQNIFTRLKNNQKAECSVESQTQRGLGGFGGLRNVRRLRGARFAEYGRSMVEMLGVLAIIGVLSVAGIMGYRYAMDKYRANDIIYEVNLRNRDTWHKYQLKGLPENEDMLNEWAEYTSTGFPIGVYLRSTDMFDVQVDDVPSRVCLNVLNTNLEGPLLIWVPTGEDEKQLFDGTNAEELCQYGEEDAENVSIVFTTSLSQYGAELGGGEAVDENGRPVRYCLDDGDCTGTCERCGSDYKCESTCPDATPICSATQGKCVRCEVNDDCPINQICNEATNECEEIPEACAEDEFRSRNGACIPCSHPSNVIINGDETFGADKATGAELCANCANEGTARKLETAGDTTYCSYTCTKGISVQGKDGECHPCVNPDGTPNMESFQIDGGTESKTQCEACGNDRFWFQTVHYLKYYCASKHQCADDEFHELGSSQCIPCSDPTGYYYQIASNNQEATDYFAKSCTHCPDRLVRMWGLKYCVLSCKQPAGAPEECSDPTTCNRVWQNSSATCFSCDALTASNSIYTQDSVAVDLCLKCGRTVVPSEGNYSFCVLTQQCDATTQFLGKNGWCYSCKQANKVLIDENELSCENNCSNVSPRKKVQGYNGLWYCVPVCKDGYIHDRDGYCRIYGEYDTFSPLVVNDCEKIYGDTHMLYNTTCIPKKCPPDTFRGASNDCVSCSSPNTVYLRRNSAELESCLNCGNRIEVVRTLEHSNCIFINPGISGVCNSLENGEHENYLDGDGVLFRDSEGYCRRCDDPKTYSPSSTAQCKSCGNRRNDGGCAYGLCTDGTTFLNVNNQCISCTTSSRTEIDNITTSRSSCTECDNKRVMTAEDTSGATKAYCVNDCYGQLQNVNGQCGGSSWGNFEIGSDETSKDMCRDYERVVYSKVNGDQTKWYCSSAPRDGYFININGGLSSCTSGSTEIPDSNDARNLCLDCSGAKHTVVEKDGRFYCEKS